MVEMEAMVVVMMGDMEEVVMMGEVEATFKCGGCGRNEEEEDARDMRYADVQGVFIKATQIIVMGN